MSLAAWWGSGERARLVPVFDFDGESRRDGDRSDCVRDNSGLRDTEVINQEIARKVIQEMIWDTLRFVLCHYQLVTSNSTCQVTDALQVLVVTSEFGSTEVPCTTVLKYFRRLAHNERRAP